MNYLIKAQWERETAHLETIPMRWDTSTYEDLIDNRIYLVSEEGDPSYTDPHTRHLYFPGKFLTKIHNLIVEYARVNGYDFLSEPHPYFHLQFRAWLSFKPGTFCDMWFADMDINGRMICDDSGICWICAPTHRIDRVSFDKRVLGPEGLTWEFIDQLELLANEYGFHVV